MGKRLLEERKKDGQRHKQAKTNLDREKQTGQFRVLGKEGESIKE